jgi:putative ABC transport system substrate-binding protein
MKVHRIGYLAALDRVREFDRSDGIRTALREVGYIEGQNVVTEYQYTDGRMDRLPELAANLVRLKVDVILAAGGDPWIRAAKNATKTIPIIVTGQGSNPVEQGLVESLARPGGNVTGVTSHSRELAGKRLELFKEAVPKLARVAVLYDPSLQPSVREEKEVLPVAARALGLAIWSWEIRATDNFEKIFDAFKQGTPGWTLSGGRAADAC